MEQPWRTSSNLLQTRIVSVNTSLAGCKTASSPYIQLYLLFSSLKIVCLKQSMIQSCNSKRCKHAFIAVRILHLLQTINRMKTASPTSIKLYSSSSSLKIVGLQQSMIKSCNSKLCIHAFIAIQLLLLLQNIHLSTEFSLSWTSQDLADELAGLKTRFISNLFCFL